MNQINKFTLTFKSKEIEVLYQSQSIQKHLKPLYYGLMVMSLALNLLKIIVKYRQMDSLPYINIIIMLASIITLLIIYKKDALTQKVMALENAFVLLYQVNFNSDATGQEYYLHGSNFALIQASIYFANDFYLSFPSVIIHSLIRCLIASYISQRFDIVTCLASFGAATFLICILYICNKAQRLQFLMTLRENKIESQLPTLINKPFSKFRYENQRLFIDVDIVDFDNEIFQFQSELCSGCNLRKFLRECQIDKQSLESLVINNKIKFDVSLEARLQKRKLKIRFCSFNIDNSIIIIIDNIQDKILKSKQIPLELYLQLKKQFEVQKASLHNYQFRCGVMSLLFIGQYKVKTVNFLKILNQIITRLVLSQKKFKIQMENENKLKLTTYPYQLKIFLIQIFNIILCLETESYYLDEINIRSFDLCIAVQFGLQNQKKFLEYYSSNFFIKQTQQHLLFSPVTQDLIFFFNRKIPYADFNQKF